MDRCGECIFEMINKASASDTFSEVLVPFWLHIVSVSVHYEHRSVPLLSFCFYQFFQCIQYILSWVWFAGSLIA